MNEETLAELLKYAGHERGADLPMSQSIPECTFWSNHRMCSCGFNKARDAALAASASSEGEISDELKELIRSPEFKKGIEESLEDIKAGRVTPWPEVAKRLGLNIQKPEPESGSTICRCENMCDSCKSYLIAYYTIREHNRGCTTPDCVDGRIEKEVASD